MVKGSCVCGQLTYEFTGEYMDFVSSHLPRPSPLSPRLLRFPGRAEQSRAQQDRTAQDRPLSESKPPEKLTRGRGPRSQVACHCIPCRKTSGADRSLNLAIKKSAVTTSPGAPVKQLSRAADSGGEMVYHECGNCGSIMYAAPAGGADVAYLKVGLIDDVDFVNGLGAPKMEIYCKHLWSWEKTFDGAKLIQS